MTFFQQQNIYNNTKTLTLLRRFLKKCPNYVCKYKKMKQKYTTLHSYCTTIIKHEHVYNFLLKTKFNCIFKIKLSTSCYFYYVPIDKYYHIIIIFLRCI